MSRSGPTTGQALTPAYVGHAPAAHRLVTPSRTAQGLEIIVHNFVRLVCLARNELGEPGAGANVFRRLSGHRDLLGSFALVRASSSDSVRLSRTARNCMACRRSGGFESP